MSVDTFVFVQDDRLPTMAELQKALDRADVGIALENVDDLRSMTGFWPAMHRGNASGFEWYFGTVENYCCIELPADLGSRQHVINFVTHSDMRELVSAILTVAVVAQLADGLVYDEESNRLVNGDTALEIAKKVEAEL